METSPLIGPDGKPIKTNTIPVVKYKDFVFPMRLLSADDIVKPGAGGQLRPGDIIKEYRSAYTELSDRVNLLTAILCTIIQDGIAEGKIFLESTGAQSTDLNDKVLYPRDGA